MKIAVLLLLAGAGAAQAQGQAALAELDSAGRAIAAQGCARPVEDKSNTTAGGEEMQSLDCGGFRVASVVSRRDGRERRQPMALVVLAPSTPLPAWLSFGMEARALRAQLGPPALERPTNLSYRLDASRPAGDSITFEFERDRLRAVAWNWQID